MLVDNKLDDFCSKKNITYVKTFKIFLFMGFAVSIVNPTYELSIVCSHYTTIQKVSYHQRVVTENNYFAM